MGPVPAPENENYGYEEEKWSKPPTNHSYFSNKQVEEKAVEEKWQKKSSHNQSHKKQIYAPEAE